MVLSTQSSGLHTHVPRASERYRDFDSRQLPKRVDSDAIVQSGCILTNPLGALQASYTLVQKGLSSPLQRPILILLVPGRVVQLVSPEPKTFRDIWESFQSSREGQAVASRAQKRLNSPATRLSSQVPP